MPRPALIRGKGLQEILDEAVPGLGVRHDDGRVGARGKGHEVGAEAGVRAAVEHAKLLSLTPDEETEPGRVPDRLEHGPGLPDGEEASAAGP